MADKLTSKQTQTQQVDPTLAKESDSLVNLFRLLASGGFEPNRGETIAALTSKQEDAMDMGDAAATAFGFPVGARTDMPAPTTSATGVRGYSTAAEFDKSRSLLPASYLAMLEEFKNTVRQPVAQQGFKKAGK